MATYLIFGAVVAFAAAVQPGPFQAYLISRALTVGWRRTLPAALSPLVSDGPVIVVVLLVLSRMPHAAIEGLRCAGGVLLLVLAVRALRTWRRFDNAVAASAAPSAGRSVLAGALVNILNPGPWLGWSLVLGPMLVKGWREAPSHGIALIAGFYATMVASLTAIIVAFGAARGFGPKVERSLVGVSAAALALFGAWQLWSGAAALVGR
jgi:threonine/homoserine/homoserine lactone efflux protein